MCCKVKQGIIEKVKRGFFGGKSVYFKVLCDGKSPVCGDIGIEYKKGLNHYRKEYHKEYDVDSQGIHVFLNREDAENFMWMADTIHNVLCREEDFVTAGTSDGGAETAIFKCVEML